MDALKDHVTMLRKETSVLSEDNQRLKIHLETRLKELEQLQGNPERK